MVSIPRLFNVTLFCQMWHRLHTTCHTNTNHGFAVFTTLTGIFFLFIFTRLLISLKRGNDSNDPLHPPPIFPPKCPAVAPIDSCPSSRTNLSCQGSRAQGLVNSGGLCCSLKPITLLALLLTWKHKNQRLFLFVCFKPKPLHTGALGSTKRHQQKKTVEEYFAPSANNAVWLLENQTSRSRSLWLWCQNAI